MSENKLKVLIVEDEEDLREIFTQALLGKGIEVLQAQNGKEALETLEKNEKINLVLLDIIMPDMDGFDVLRKMKSDARYASIPVIVSTNLEQGEDKKEALRLGAAEYYVKSNHTPFELADLVGGYLDKKTV